MERWERREKRRIANRNRMRKSGRSVFTIQEILYKRAQKGKAKP